MTDCEQPTYKSVLIHASAVEYKGRALVFLGPSGTGKSTISQLLARTVENINILADDKVCFDALANGGWMVSNALPRLLQNTPGAKSDTASRYVPLGAIFRLYQAPSPRLEPLSMLDTCLYLIKAFAEIVRKQPDIPEKNMLCFVSLADIARVTPGYELYCDRSSNTADILRQEIVYI